MRRPAPLLALLFALALPPAAIAETVEVSGTPGTDGAAGADGSPGEPGDPGGNGGDALAVADAPGEDNVAVARGGAGGDGGSGGDGLAQGSAGGAGGDGGDSGSATARAIGVGALSVSARAETGSPGRGGQGGDGAPPGEAGPDGEDGSAGALFAEAILDTDRAEAVSATAQVGTFPLFGFGGGTARARVVNAGTGSVDVLATAHSGLAEAYGSGAGDVTAHARLVDAREGGTASAEGVSSGGGDVTVETFLISIGLPEQGEPLALHDAVSGSTSGRLTLRQQIGTLRGGFGDVAMSLSAENPGGGDLVLDVDASTGLGNIQLGDVIGASDTGADVEIDVIAVMRGPGEVVLEGAGGNPTRIHGESNGGAVDVGARLGGGRQVDGQSFDLENLVTGDTTGDLTLYQHLVGGPAGGFVPAGEYGSSGSATSSLVKHTASSSLTMVVAADGGDSASPILNTPVTTFEAGAATARADASNSAGSVEAWVSAQGGDWLSNFVEGEGADASAEVLAQTSGDGHEVSVGRDWLGGPGGSIRYQPGAIGGFAGRFIESSDGGRGTSHSTGRALGDSRVTVFDLAVGGDGSGVGGTSIPVQHAGTGGAADSTAIASGAGTSAVAAKSQAFGGAAGSGAQTQGVGGDAVGRAEATGLGRVEAWARGVGGSAPGAVGAGSARATATGASGFARAEALSGAGALAQVRAQSEAVVGSRSDTAARAASGASLAEAALAPGVEGLAFLTSDPTAEDRDFALASNAAAAGRFAEAPGSEWLALGSWHGAGRAAGEGVLALASELEIVLGDVDFADELAFAVLDLESVGDGFEGLSFALERNGSALGAMEHFETLDDALAFFRDALFDFGASLERGDSLLARFQLELAPETTFALRAGFARIVPEPGTGALVALGLAGLAARRRAKPRR